MSDVLAPPAPAAPPAPPAAGALSGLMPDQERAGREMPKGWPQNELSELLLDWMAMPNIADELEEAECDKLAQIVTRDYNLDEGSRADWLDKYRKWLDMAMQVVTEKTFPWPGASNFLYPLLTTAAIQFHARAYPAVINNRNVVKGTVWGPDDGVPAVQNGQPVAGPDGQPAWLQPPGSKKTVADKIGEHMSWQLLDEQEEWEPETDKLLLVLPIVGCMFRKSYFDPAMKRNVSRTVTADLLCVNYKAASFEVAPRKTEILTLYPWEIERNIRGGVFLDQDYGADQGQSEDEDAPTTFLEQHRRYDLDQDGYDECYIVTIAKQSGKLARIVAAFDEDGVEWTKDGRILSMDAVGYYTPYIFMPSPDSGVYGMGFGHLLYPMNIGINTCLNQLFDAGTLANTQSGFIGSNMSMNTGAVRMQIGQLNPINNPGGSIRDAIYMIEYPGPSVVLFQLLQFMVDAAKSIAQVQDVTAGEMPSEQASGISVLALIEQGLSVYTAIYKRTYRSLKHEFAKLFRLNRLYLPQQAGYQIGDEWRTITQQDYARGHGVEPISDPKMMTDMQRLGRAQLLMSFRGDPWVDQREIRVQALTSAGFPNVDKLVLKQTPPDPKMAIEVGKLHAQQADMDLRQRELDVRARHEEGDLQIRRGKDKAAEVESLTRAILNLANAHKADHEVDQQWAQTQIAVWQARIEALNAGSTDPSTDPAAAANPGGTQPAGVQPVAPAPGNAAVPPVPGGPLGGPSGQNAPGLAGP